MKTRTTSVLFAHSRLDAIPVLAGIAQLAFLLALYFGFRRLPWWVLLPAGFVTAEFLCRLGRDMPDKARFFIWRLNGRPVAFSLCMVHGDTLYDEYLGMDYSVALGAHLYFLTLRDIWEWARVAGYRRYCSNGSSYEPKLHLGFELVPLDLYVRHESALVNRLLKRLLPVLEPTHRDPTLRKFRNFASLWRDE